MFSQKNQNLNRRVILYKMVKKICANKKCDVKFTPKNHQQKYCSVNCRDKQFRLNKKIKSSKEIQEVAKYKCVECEKRAVGFMKQKPYCKEHYQKEINTRKRGILR